MILYPMVVKHKEELPGGPRLSDGGAFLFAVKTEDSNLTSRILVKVKTIK